MKTILFVFSMLFVSSVFSGRSCYVPIEGVIPNVANIYDEANAEMTYIYGNFLTMVVPYADTNSTFVGYFDRAGYSVRDIGVAPPGVPEITTSGNTYQPLVIPGSSLLVSQLTGGNTVSMSDFIVAYLPDEAPLENVVFQNVIFSDGSSPACHLVSSSCTEFFCLLSDKMTINKYNTTKWSNEFTFVESIVLTQMPVDDKTYTYGPFFAWDGTFFSFGYSHTQYSLTAMFYHPDGQYYTNITYGGTGSIHSLYYSWSTGQYISTDGFGIRQHGTVIHGTASSDSTVWYTSLYHELSCLPGIFGPTCSAICDCSNQLCKDGVDGDGSCFCDIDYYGPNCSMTCDCVNGECNDGVDGDGSCSCDDGFYGLNCSNACKCVNGECNDGVDGDGSCSCYDGFYGPNCFQACDCMNGECNDSVDGDGSCICDDGFYGLNCSNACKCVNGECNDGADGDGSCSCNDGFYGLKCSNACECVNGECNEGTNGDGSCSCDAEWEGINCEIDVISTEVEYIDLCESRPDIECGTNGSVDIEEIEIDSNISVPAINVDQITIGTDANLLVIGNMEVSETLNIQGSLTIWGNMTLSPNSITTLDPISSIVVQGCVQFGGALILDEIPQEYVPLIQYSCHTGEFDSIEVINCGEVKVTSTEYSNSLLILFSSDSCHDQISIGQSIILSITTILLCLGILA